MDEDAGRDGYGERQGHEPEVEGQVGMRGDEARESGGEVTDEEGHQQRADEQGEHPLDDEPEGQPETHAACGVDKRYEGGDE